MAVRTVVVWLRSSKAQNGAPELQGLVEEVDSGEQRRFCSTGELLRFLHETLAKVEED